MSIVLLTDTPPSSGLFLPERGSVRLVDGRFQTDDGLFPWRGFSWFTGFLRMCRGENIRPDLKYFRAHGINLPRLFGPLPWAETPDYRVENFRWDLLPTFFALLSDEGLRQNWSLCHYKDPGIPALRAFVQRFIDAAEPYPLVSFIEGTNEPHNGSEKPDPKAVLDGLNLRGLIAAYGYYPDDHRPTMPPILHFGTVHLPRDSGWARKARDAQWLARETGKIWVSDEPKKIAEPGFVGAGVANDPETTPAEAAWHAGVSALWLPGCTIHTQAGRNGTVPAPGSLTHAAMEAVRDHVWLKLNADVQTGGYTGSHFNTSPVDHIPMVWSYSSMHGDRAWSVRCDFSAPQAAHGWRVVERWGPSGSFVELKR